MAMKGYSTPPDFQDSRLAIKFSAITRTHFREGVPSAEMQSGVIYRPADWADIAWYFSFLNKTD